MTRWTESREFSTGYFRLWLLFKIYKLCGRRILKAIIFPIVLSAFVFLKGARKASHEYLSVIYKLTERKDLRPTLLNSFRHIYSFAESLLDKVAAWTGDITDDMVVYENEKDAAEFFTNMRTGKGIFVICSHLGNVEILRALASDEGRNITVNAFMAVEQTQTFNDFIKRINPAAMLNLYSTSSIGIETAVAIKDSLNKGEIAVMAGDRTAASGEKNSVEISFLGRPAKFPVGAFRFALAMECDICFLAICKNHQNKYSVYSEMHEHKHEQGKKADALMKEYVNWLEKTTLQHPYQWYNFYSFWHYKGQELHQ